MFFSTTMLLFVLNTRYIFNFDKKIGFHINCAEITEEEKSVVSNEKECSEKNENDEKMPKTEEIKENCENESCLEIENSKQLAEKEESESNSEEEGCELINSNNTTPKNNKDSELNVISQLNKSEILSDKLQETENVKKSAPMKTTQIQKEYILHLKILDGIFKVFRKLDYIQKYFSENSTNDIFFNNLKASLMDINIKDIPKDQQIADFAEEFLNEYETCYNPKLNIQSFIKCFAEFSNVLNDKFMIFNQEKSPKNTKDALFDKLYEYRIKFTKLPLQKKNPDTRYIIGYGDNCIFKFIGNKLMAHPPKNLFAKKITSIFSGSKYNVQVLNYPIYLFVYSGQKTKYFKSNLIKRSGGFKKIRFYRASYRIIGFLQVNSKKENYSYFVVQEKVNSVKINDLLVENKISDNDAKNRISNNDEVLVLLEFVRYYKD